MSITFAPGWHTIARHKIVALLVAVAAAVALTIALVLTVGTEPATSQTTPTRTVQPTSGPGDHLNCNTRIVASYC